MYWFHSNLISPVFGPGSQSVTAFSAITERPWTKPQTTFASEETARWELEGTENVTVCRPGNEIDWWCSRPRKSPTTKSPIFSDNNISVGMEVRKNHERDLTLLSLDGGIGRINPGQVNSKPWTSRRGSHFRKVGCLFAQNLCNTVLVLVSNNILKCSWLVLVRRAWS